MVLPAAATVTFGRVASDDVKNLFGKRLRLLRKSRGLTLERLGEIASIGYKHIADVERGEKAPSFEAIQKLADALGVAVHDLFMPSAEGEEPLSLPQLAREIERSGSPAVRDAAVSLLRSLRDLDRKHDAR